ncbi:MAG: sigma-70 family RNA polymerase sigma factor [Planctomycetota bacterium]
MTDLPQTRQSLLVRLSQKSGDAWSEFLEVYEQSIYSFARRRGLQDADAWDVTQDVLAAVEKKVATWDHDPTLGKFRGWLFRVARNIAVDKILAQARRSGTGDSQVAEMLNEHPQSLEQETSQFWTNYRRKLLRWAAGQIKPDVKETSWQSFWQTAIEGESPELVAKQLGLSVGSVYAAKFRIVNRIRQIVSRLDDQHDPASGEFLNDFLDQDQGKW